jgi:hypothetical protein
MAKRKTTDTFTDLRDVLLPPIKASKHALHEVAWSLPVDHGPRILLPADRERPIVSSLADFQFKTTITAYSNDTTRVLTQHSEDEVPGTEDESEAAVTKLLGLPNRRTETPKMSREQEERLISLHIKSFRDPHADVLYDIPRQEKLYKKSQVPMEA